MRRFYLVLTAALALCLGCKNTHTETCSLRFAPEAGEAGTITLATGETINYTAYTSLYYVENVVDSTYQYLNVFVPDGATQQTPIFLRTYVGGYMASQASTPQAGDASGRALKEGYVLVIPGTRGRNSKVGETYTGRAPACILDLKAALRYLHYFDAQMPGDANKIITDGTSAGGAMSALMGGTCNHPDYEPYLKEMGAAPASDAVYAAVCFCPITDLDHADMAYEWLYGGTDSRLALSEELSKVSKELADQFPEYIKSLNLKLEDGTPLTADNYLDFVKSELIRSAQIAKNAGADIDESLGFTFSSAGGWAPPINGGVNVGGPKMDEGPKSQGSAPMRAMGGGQKGEYITDLDMPTYLNYVVSTQALKTAPAFDSMLSSFGQADSGENQEFGDETGSAVNFTDYVAALNGVELTEEIRTNVHLLNPMYYIGDAKTDVAPHWYIRHGARDRDTAFPIALNLATKLKNEGYDVNFLLAWNRPHSGDYALDELFDWIESILQ